MDKEYLEREWANDNYNSDDPTVSRFLLNICICGAGQKEQFFLTVSRN